MHYKVIVLGTDIDKLLAPYSEHIKTEPYFYRTWEDVRKESNKIEFSFPDALTEEESIMSEKYGNNASLLAEKAKKKNEEYQKKEKNRRLLLSLPIGLFDSDKSKDKNAPKAALYAFVRKMGDEIDDKTLKEYLEDEQNYIFDEENNQLSTYNPKSKWDWYVEGGRFDLLPLKDESKYEQDIITIEDIKWEADDESLEELKEFWNGYVLKQNPEEYDDMFIYKREYFLDKYKTLENYLAANKYNLGYAIVTPDGEWHEPGKMGYFSSLGSYEDELDFEINAYKRYIKPLPKDTPVWVVDCHI